MVQLVESTPAMRETWVRSLGWDDPLLYSGLENSKDCIVHGVIKSQTQLSDFHFHFFKEDRRLNFKLLTFCDVLAFYFFIGL